MNKFIVLALLGGFLLTGAACQKRKPNEAAALEKKKQSDKSVAAVEQPSASYSMLYSWLERYGEWIETDKYGFVWQPNEAQRSRAWRPYLSGRWAFSDAGWLWISSEPFGWAVYHYGRWIRLRHVGWIWTPDEQWAPAWVSWRKSSEHIGWAPLPPEARFDAQVGIRNWADNYYEIGPDQYSFVPIEQFGAQRVGPTVLPSEENLALVNQTTNVTNLHVGRDTNVVLNHGPDFAELQRRTQHPIERLRVARRTVVRFLEENPKPTIDGETIEMPAPILAQRRPAEKPKRVREKLSYATIDRGWEMVVDSESAERVRMKIKSESAPPEVAPAKAFVRQSRRGAKPVSAAP
jgi:hypothetical protein